MCWNQIIGVATQAGQVMLQGGQNADTLNANADMLDLKAADTLTRGGVSEDIQRNKTRQLLGFQRAAMGASGVQVDSGSGGKVLEQTAGMGELDALNTRTNAMREAWGYTNEAENARAQAIAAGAMQRMLLPGTSEDGFLKGLNSKEAFLGGFDPLGLAGGSRANYINTGKRM